jgi:hypothetical protein
MRARRNSTKTYTHILFTVFTYCWLHVLTARQLLQSSPVPAPPSCGGLIPGCAFASCPFSIVGTRSILTCPRCRGSTYIRSVDGTRCGEWVGQEQQMQQGQPGRLRASETPQRACHPLCYGRNCDVRIAAVDFAGRRRRMQVQHSTNGTTAGINVTPPSCPNMSPPSTTASTTARTS